MNCIVCGGDHMPSPSTCDVDGMDRQIAKLGAKRWNALTAHVAKVNNRAAGAPAPIPHDGEKP